MVNGNKTIPNRYPKDLLGKDAASEGLTIRNA